MTLAAWITVLSVVLVGSTGSGGFVYWALNRNSQKAIDSRTDSEREKFMAEAAEKWQRIIDENATKAYQRVEDRCKRCETDLERLVAPLGDLLGALAPVMEQVAQRTPVDAELVHTLTDAIQAVQREYQKHT